MTVFVITMLFIWAMIATAMSITFWRAWRENISDLGHALDRLNWFPDDLEDLEDSPGIVRDGAPVQEYGKTGDDGDEWGVSDPPLPPELDAILDRIRSYYGGTDVED